MATNRRQCRPGRREIWLESCTSPSPQAIATSTRCTSDRGSCAAAEGLWLQSRFLKMRAGSMWPEHVQVQTGDTVTINHAGFEDVTHKQFDSNGKEPFKARSRSP